MSQSVKNKLLNTFKSKNNEGVKTLLGEPRKAIIKLAVPMILAMSAMTIYNVVDAIWVSGLGHNALAAIGFVYPFFFIILAISTGLGVGGGSAISRKIGSKDKPGADNVAVHTMIIMVIMAVIITIPLFLFARDIFILLGAGSTLDLCVEYGQVIFAGTIFIFFAYIVNALLRAEGDAKRAMYVMMLGAVLNIILDPFFIYGDMHVAGLTIPGLAMGISGAAWATILSVIITSIIMANWLFFRKDTYVTLKFRGFKFEKAVIYDIIKVGIPSAIQQLAMSITMIIVIKIIVMMPSGGWEGVAVFSTGWRVVTIAVLPLLGIATAVVSVCGAAFGSKAYEKLNTAYMYAIKFGLILEIIIAAVTFILAPYISAIFTTAEGSNVIAGDLTVFLMIIVLFYPGAAFGIASSSMFQGTGKGLYALVATLLRTIIFTLVLSYIAAFILQTDLGGIWWAIVIANLGGSLVSFVWAKLYINNLLKGKKASFSVV